MVKKLVLVLAAVLVMYMPVTTVMAHGSSHKNKVTYSQCSVEDCSETGIHTHDGTTYCGHEEQDNHTSHKTSHKNRSHH